MWFAPSSHQRVTAVPSTALWNPTIPATSVQRWVHVHWPEVQLASGTLVAVAPGAPASWSVNRYPEYTEGDPYGYARRNALARTYLAPHWYVIVSPLRSVSGLSTNTPACADGSSPF